MTKTNIMKIAIPASLRVTIQSAADMCVRSHQFHRDWMAASYGIYLRVGNSPAELVELNAIIAESGAQTGSRTDVALKVIKATTPQPSDNKADSARAAILRKAAKAGIKAEEFAAWYAENNGTNAGRPHAVGGPVNRSKAIARAASKLDAITKPIASVKTGPLVVTNGGTPKFVVGIFRPGERGGYELLHLEADSGLTDTVLFHFGKADHGQAGEDVAVAAE